MKVKELSDEIVTSFFESIIDNAPTIESYFTTSETDNWWKSFKYVRNANKELQRNAIAILQSDESLDLLGEIIGQDNNEKWKRLLGIYYANYDALHDINMTEQYEGSVEKDVSEDVKSKNETYANGSTSNSVYGFNSSVAVPTDDSETSSNTTTTSLKADNERVLSDDTGEAYTRIRAGNSRPISELYEKEWKARLNNIIDVIMSDIADYLCINVY